MLAVDSLGFITAIMCLKIDQMPNKSPEPTRMDASILRLSVLIRPATVPAWLSFFR